MNANHQESSYVRIVLRSVSRPWEEVTVMTDVHALVEEVDRLAENQIARNAEIKRLRDTLAEIVAIPGDRTLLLNAEARAMYEIAKRTLESESVLG